MYKNTNIYSTPLTSNNLFRSLDTSLEAIVRFLLAVIIIEQQALAFALENTRNPAVLVANAPNSHTNALLDVQAGAGNVLPDESLTGNSSRVDGSGVQTDIDLSVGNVNAEIGGGAESSFESGLVRSGAGVGVGAFRSQVALVADTIDVDAIGLDELDDADGASSLIAVVLDIVVIVEKKSLGGVLLGETEGDGDKSLADGVVEDAGAVGTVLVESLINDIPLVAVVGPSGSKSLDVILHNLNQSGVVEATLRNPSRQLRVPYQSVATELQAVVFGKVGVAVTISESEIALGGLGRLPLHGVLGRHRVELGLDDVQLFRLVAQSDGSTNVAASTLDDGLVESVILAAWWLRATWTAWTSGRLRRSWVSWVSRSWRRWWSRSWRWA